MLKLARLVALCAAVATLFAFAATTASAASEKSEVKKYARKVANKEWKKLGFAIGLENTRASCKDRGTYWACSAVGNGGQCNGTLRVYPGGETWMAPRKYRKLGCIAD